MRRLVYKPGPGLKDATRAAQCHCTWDGVFSSSGGGMTPRNGEPAVEAEMYCTSYWESEASHDSGTRDNNVKSER
jgi:hypothetical protein